MSGLTVAEVLSKAADLIEPGGKWKQRIFYRDGDCFCMVGAVREAAGAQCAADIEQGPIGAVLHSSLVGEQLRDSEGGEGIYVWNDAEGRTQAEVVAKLREAAAIAKAAGK